MKNTYYQFINYYKKKYIYNTLTGIFFEINNITKKLLSSADKLLFHLQPELNNYLYEYNFIISNDNKKIDYLYPKVSPYAIWDNDYLAYYLHNQEYLVCLNTKDKLLFELCSGDLMVKDIIHTLNISREDFIKKLIYWADFNKQIIKLFNKAYNSKTDEIFFKYFLCLSEKHKERKVISNQYYYDNINDPYIQFDEKETTVSYLLRKDTNILDSGTYGAQFCKECLRKLPDKSELKVLEIGGGTGDFAMCFINMLVNEKKKYRYSICDQSDKLIMAQKTKCKAFLSQMEFYNQNVETLILPSITFDLVISNEVIADLTSVKVSRLNYYAIYYIKKYKLDGILKIGDYINIGAIRLIEKVSHILKNGGFAIITEYSEKDNVSKISNCMYDHIEVSINFNVLYKVSEILGLSPQIMSLTDFLEIDENTMVLSPGSYMPFRTLMRKHSFDFEKLIYKKEVIEKQKTYNARFINIKQIIGFFKVLILHKK